MKTKALIERKEAFVSLLNEGKGRLREAGIETFENELRLMTESVWGRSYLECLLDPPGQLTVKDKNRFRALIRERVNYKPLQYLLKKTGFYRHEFDVAEGVLIPRPETEVLVDQALSRIENNFAGREKIKVLDLCCGSGVIGISVALACKAAEVTAADVSQEAVGLTQFNAKKLNASSKVAALKSDLFETLKEDEKFDLLLCNPPYISSPEWAKLPREVRENEPREALIGGEDGLDFYRRIFQYAPRYLNDGAWLLLEIGERQAAAISDLLWDNAVFSDFNVYPDLNGRDRVVELKLRKQWINF